MIRSHRGNGDYYVVDRLFAAAELRLGEKKQMVELIDQWVELYVDPDDGIIGPAPLLGEHSELILRDCGYDIDQVSHMRRENVI